MPVRLSPARRDAIERGLATLAEQLELELVGHLPYEILGPVGQAEHERRAGGAWNECLRHQQAEELIVDAKGRV